jgi:hypothetical protein
MIIHHAEEPEGQIEPPFGVNSDGVRAKGDGSSLTIRGWQRAGALAVLFGTTTRALRDSRLAVPTRIYAENSPARLRETDRWNCAWETIMPLAARLALAPNLSFVEGDEQTLANDVLSQKSETVLIAWDAVPILARHLMRIGAGTINPIPENWPRERFDLVWVLTPPRSSAERWGFDQVPQMLLEGDANSIIL